MYSNIYYVYILSNAYHTVFYTGVTNNLLRRCIEHRNKTNKGFTSKYNINKLVYFETFSSIDLAIQREKQIKKYHRQLKIQLINSINDNWVDLFMNGTIISIKPKFVPTKEEEDSHGAS